MTALLLCAVGTSALSAPRAPAAPRSAVGHRCAATMSAAATRCRPPTDKTQMLRQATDAVAKARADGIDRHTLRLFLPRGDEGELSPTDESWVGGIMQLYSVASPLVRELLVKMGTAVAGVPPALTEQRLDASGVDGESLWSAQGGAPEDDAIAFVQPSTEQMERVEGICRSAGSRPVMLVNPQWKERDDPLDALSRKGGLLGSFGSFLGGKAATEGKLETLGFKDVYTLAIYRCRGSIIHLVLSYPDGWTAYYRQGVDDEDWKELIVSAERPTYQEVEEALIARKVPLRLTEFDSIV